MTKTIFLTAAFAALGLGAASAHAAPQSLFDATFIDNPTDQLSAVQALVAGMAPTGASAETVVATLRQGGAVCISKPSAYHCVYRFLQHPTGNDIEDISWQIHIDTQPDGTIAGQKVERTVAGM